MHQHALYAVLQRHSARVACPAGSAQLQLDVAIFKSPELYVASVFLNGRPDARLEKFLDHANDLVVVLVVGQAILLGGLVAFPSLDDVDDGLARGDGLRDEGEDLGPDMRPVCIASLGDGDEVGTVEDGRDAVNVHELGSQRGRVRRRDGRSRVQVLDERRVERGGDDAVIREELEGVRVGRVLGLDEDGAGAAAAGEARREVSLSVARGRRRRSRAARAQDGGQSSGRGAELPSPSRRSSDVASGGWPCGERAGEHPR